MKSKSSIFLENTFVYKWLFIIALPIYFFAEQNNITGNITFLFNLFILFLSALSFRKIWIQVISSGMITYIGELSFAEMNLHMSLFRWITSFILAAFIMTLIEKYLSEKRNTSDLITSLAKSLDSRDEYTAFHSNNVAEYAKKIAIEMKLPQSTCENIYFGGLLHDIGKIGIPESILNKPASLTDQEYDFIKQHPVTGYNMVKHINRFKDNGILEMILHHHERFDGKGYPRGLKENEIPLAARIMAVADSFDAMTSKRAYKTQSDWQNALNELNLNKGTQFDPLVVNAFINAVKQNQVQFIQYNQNSKQKNLITNNMVC